MATGEALFPVHATAPGAWKDPSLCGECNTACLMAWFISCVPMTQIFEKVRREEGEKGRRGEGEKGRGQVSDLTVATTIHRAKTTHLPV